MSETATTLLEVAKKGGELYQRTHEGSLVEFTQPTRVEAPVLVDMRASTLPYIDEVLHSALNLFTGYYLLAVHLKLTINDTRVIKTLDSLNPERSTNFRSFEDFGVGLPFYSEEEYSQEEDSLKQLREDADLSVGKLINISVRPRSGEEVSKDTIEIPVMVRLRTRQVSPDVLTHTLSLHDSESIHSRYHKWRAGQIRFFADVLFAQDLIEEHREALKKDESGFYEESKRRADRNYFAALLSKDKSVAGASSIFVLTSDTAREVEREMNISFDKSRDREKLFKDTHSQLIYLIDPDWDQVTIYHRSIPEPTEVTVREIQRAHTRKGGPDITEVFNALRQSKSPTF